MGGTRFFYKQSSCQGSKNVKNGQFVKQLPTLKTLLSKILVEL